MVIVQWHYCGAAARDSDIVSTEFHAGWTEVSNYDSANEDQRCLSSGLGTGQVFFILGCIVVLDSPRQFLQQVSHSVQSWCRKSIREMSLSIENLLIKTTAWLCAIESKQLWGEHLFYLYVEKRL